MTVKKETIPDIIADAPDVKKTIKKWAEKKTFHSPETMGKIKKDNIFHWSVDELIEYKSTGVRPALVLDDNYLFQLGRCGVSLENIAHLFCLDMTTIANHPTWTVSHREGRAQAGARVRALILEQALEGNLTAMLYIDKQIGGDTNNTPQVQINVSTQPLKGADTDNLLEIACRIVDEG